MFKTNHTAEALELLFTSTTPGWFTPFTRATDGLTAAQAATVPAPRFNSVWAVVNHVRYWQEATLHQLQHLPNKNTALDADEGSGWPPAGDPGDEAAWQRARTRAIEANAALARYVAGLTDAELDHALAAGDEWHTRRHLIYSMIAHNSYHTCEITTIRHMQGWWFDAM